MKKCITGIMVALMAMGMFADSLDDIKAELSELKSQLAKVQKKNPCVYYAEKDNPGMNVQKRMKKTYINHTFMCPYHKGFMYNSAGKCEGCSGWRDYACKAQRFWLEWNRLVESISVTEQCESEIEELKEKIQELEDKKNDAVADGVTAKKRESKTGSSGKKTIRIKRSTFEKLVETGVAEGENLILKVVDD